MRKAFVGIDAAFAKRKRLPIALCSWEGGRLLPYQLRTLSVEPPRGSGNAAVLDDEVVQTFAAAAARYVERLAEELGVEIVRIGIDAPSAPRPESLSRREAERALDAAGISCFATPTASRIEEIRAKVKAHLGRRWPGEPAPTCQPVMDDRGLCSFRAPLGGWGVHRGLPLRQPRVRLVPGTFTSSGLAALMLSFVQYLGTRAGRRTGRRTQHPHRLRGHLRTTASTPISPPGLRRLTRRTASPSALLPTM